MNYSVRYDFHGDYIGIRRHTTWKNTIRKNGLRKLGRYVVFGAIVNKIHMSSEEVLFSLKSKCLKFFDLKKSIGLSLRF